MPEQEHAERKRRMAARKAQIQDRLPKVNTVHVEPATDILRSVVKHPRGAAFPASGPVEWPHDRFTKRRIADGTVTVVSRDKDKATPEAPTRHSGRGSSTAAAAS